MSHLVHRAAMAATLAGAMVASGMGLGIAYADAPATSPNAAVAASSTTRPQITSVQQVGSFFSARWEMKLTSNPGLTSVDLRDPVTDKIVARRVVDYAGSVDEEGNHSYRISFTNAEVQSALSVAYPDGKTPTTLKAVAWDEQGQYSARATLILEHIGMDKVSIGHWNWGIPEGGLTMYIGQNLTLQADYTPKEATETKINWTVVERGMFRVNDHGVVTARKEGCSDIHASADYTEHFVPTREHPDIQSVLQATTSICAYPLTNDAVFAPTTYRTSVENGSEVRIGLLIADKYKDATFEWSNEHEGSVARMKVAEDGRSVTVTPVDSDHSYAVLHVAAKGKDGATIMRADGEKAEATVIVDTNVMPVEAAPAPYVEPVPTPDPEPSVDPAPTPDPEPSTDPAPTPDPTVDPVPTPDPEPSTDPAPTPDPEPSADPMPNPDPEPVPTPDPTVEPTPDPAPAGQWMHNGHGWWYRNADGTWPAGKAMTIDGMVYRFDASGYMRTGWVYDGGNWYYHNTSGAQVTGWIMQGRSWYYLTPSGSMATGWVKVGSSWYYMSASGTMMTGWRNIGGSWYYLTPSGAMATGWISLHGTWYYLMDSGIMATGWVHVGDTWYYMRSSGAMVTGWVHEGNAWYYMSASGAMVTGTTHVGNRDMRFASNGVWLG